MSLVFNIPWESFLSLTIVHFFAVISPGPALIVQMNISVNKGRKLGNYCALGVGVGIGLHLLYTFLGLAQLIESNVWLSRLVIIMAIVYFSYLFRGLLKVPQSVNIEQPVAHASATSKDAFTSFSQGFASSAINPNAIVFSITMFTPLINPDWTFFACSLMLLWLCLNCVIIYIGFNFIFSNPRISSYYFKKRFIFDRIIALFFAYLIICFAAKLLPDSLTEPISFLLYF
ncbi:LysE family translocator [Bacteroides propionicifaciens]|jgi:threonine efflux protein|uniref:LysE family translocator n=1 Tax=Bacteroides propionicifaciens TaxID=392838 RepID=UPI000367B9F1|nr:LysE family translocator [Bacteroides propionicifaciens]